MIRNAVLRRLRSGPASVRRQWPVSSESPQVECLSGMAIRVPWRHPRECVAGQKKLFSKGFMEGQISYSCGARIHGVSIEKWPDRRSSLAQKVTSKIMHFSLTPIIGDIVVDVSQGLNICARFFVCFRSKAVSDSKWATLINPTRAQTRILSKMNQVGPKVGQKNDQSGIELCTFWTRLQWIRNETIKKFQK